MRIARTDKKKDNCQLTSNTTRRETKELRVVLSTYVYHKIVIIYNQDFITILIKIQLTKEVTILLIHIVDVPYLNVLQSYRKWKTTKSH